MFKCITIDDEYYARKRIMHCVDWESHGCRVTAEAANVQQALELLADDPADLAVVDITMPGETGLDFIAKASQLYPGMYFIVLSGYSEFEYARQAMRYGVESYLTKPVNSGEMEQAVLRAVQVLQERRQQIASTFWRSFFHRGTATAEDMSMIDESFGISPEHTYILLMADFACAAHTGYAKRRRQGAVAAKTLLETLLTPCLVASYDHFGHNLFVVEQDSQQRLENSLTTVLSKLAQHEPTRFYFGLSLPQHGTAQGLLDAYHQAELAFLSKVFAQTSAILQYAPADADLTVFTECNKRVEAALFTGSLDQLHESLTHVFQLLRASANVSLLEAELFQLLTIAKTQAGKLHLELYQMEHRLILISCRELIAESDSLEQIQAKIRSLLQPLSDRREVADSSTRLVQMAITYMEENYASYGFGLELLAAKLMVSPAYLSNLFHKGTGVTVMQYITRLRMEAACELLAGKGHTVQETAELLGYNDAYYFSKSFKKFYGTSPSQYRRAGGQRIHELLPDIPN